MYKVMYWSIRKEKLIILIFRAFDDLMEYLSFVQEDIDLDEHFIKIVKENTEK